MKETHLVLDQKTALYAVRVSDTAMLAFIPAEIKSTLIAYLFLVIPLNINMLVLFTLKMSRSLLYLVSDGLEEIQVRVVYTTKKNKIHIFIAYITYIYMGVCVCYAHLENRDLFFLNSSPFLILETHLLHRDRMSTHLNVFNQQHTLNEHPAFNKAPVPGLSAGDDSSVGNKAHEHLCVLLCLGPWKIHKVLCLQ